MIVAVAWDNGNIGEHFGHASMFAIYNYAGFNPEECEKRLVDCSDKHGHADMANLMRENKVDAVIAGRIGSEARATLLSFGIIPVAGYEGDADTAADLLITGRLPIMDDSGSCGGGCGGCSGCHAGDETGSCGCGCGDDDGGCGCGG